MISARTLSLSFSAAITTGNTADAALNDVIDNNITAYCVLIL